MTLRPLLSQRRPLTLQGFTLVEVLVAIVALAIGVTGLVTLTNITSGSQVALKSADSRADAIAADIAELQRINNRYTCAGLNAASGGDCLISTTDPDQDDYYPTTTDGRTNFDNRCNYLGATDLVTPLVEDLIPDNSIASTAALTASGVDREIDPDDQGNAHRYTVTYNAGDQTLATFTLVPTTAAWCP